MASKSSGLPTAAWLAIAAGCGVVALAVAGIVAAIVVPNFLSAMQRAKQHRTVADLRQVGAAVLAYAADAAAGAPGPALGPAATTAELAGRLAPKYISQVPALDGWQRPYRFACTSRSGRRRLRQLLPRQRRARRELRARRAPRLRRATPGIRAGRVRPGHRLVRRSVRELAGVPAGAMIAPAGEARRRASPGEVAAAIAAASRRFRAAPLTWRWFAFFKYRLDPCYRELAGRIPEGARVVDLGTGLAMLPIVLAVLPGERSVVGIDWDLRKLVAGRAAVNGLRGVWLALGDARSFPLPEETDAIAVVDMLHYYEVEDQRRILARAAAALAPGGQLLVRESDAARHGPSWWTRGLESFSVRAGWNRGERRTHFRRAAELRADLEGLGLEVAMAPLSGPIHPGNVLLCGRRRG